MSGKSANGTRAFSPFEWMVALRYLRARRKEGFISVIAGFSFLGIMLGVATLIIVMAVMNGFRQELFNKMLGLNGHVVVHSLDPNFGDYDAMAANVRGVQGVKYALPLIEGQVMVSTPSSSTGALVRGLREADLKQLKAVSSNIRFGTLDGFDGKEGVAVGTRLANDGNCKLRPSVANREIEPGQVGAGQHVHQVDKNVNAWGSWSGSRPGQYLELCAATVAGARRWRRRTRRITN